MKITRTSNLVRVDSKSNGDTVKHADNYFIIIAPTSINRGDISKESIPVVNLHSGYIRWLQNNLMVEPVEISGTVQ